MHNYRLIYPTVYKAVNIIASPQLTTNTALLEGTVSTSTFESYGYFTVNTSVLNLNAVHVMVYFCIVLVLANTDGSFKL